MAGMQISKQDVNNLATKYKATANQLAKYKRQADIVARQVVHGLEASGTAFLCGMANGAWGDVDADGKLTSGWDIMGVPVELLVAGGSLGLSLVLEDDLAPHLQSVSLGATCAYASTMGVAAGLRMRPENRDAITVTP